MELLGSEKRGLQAARRPVSYSMLDRGAGRWRRGMMNNIADCERSAQDGGPQHSNDGDPVKPFAHYKTE
jgi:hypothetical protein